MIDWVRVDELREAVGADDFSEVVELFLEEVEEVIERLGAAPDPRNFAADLHFLKGSALNLGFRALSDCCAEGERSLENGSTTAVDIASVIESYTASKAEFLSDPRIDRAA